jgi:hypothetical protein
MATAAVHCTAGEEAPAVIIFTSGTVGHPKAMEPSHRSLLVVPQMLLQLTRRLPHQVDEHPVMQAMWQLQQEPLPLNQTGKIDKSALAARARAAGPGAASGPTPARASR